MKLRIVMMLSIVAICSLALTRPASAFLADPGAPSSEKARLIGAWHLVSMGDSATGGNIKGTLIYTADGHMSVQLMFPPSQSTLSNDYVLNGYEASFGSYTLDEKTHTVTHHVQGSVTRGLVGKDLPRIYQLSGNRMTIRSANPEEHWSVIWEHE